MERLTTKFPNGYLFNLPSINDEKAQAEYVDKVANKLGAYEDAEEHCIEDCGCGLQEIALKYLEFLEHMHELAEYWKAEEQGLLLRLPCKVGDIVYQASKFWDKVLERTVACIVLSSGNHIYVRNGCGDSFEFGVEVFLTKEEAEQALKQMGE